MEQIRILFLRTDNLPRSPWASPPCASGRSWLLLSVAPNRAQTTMARVVAIEHVQLAMPPGEEDRARAFYSGLLGIPETPKPPHLARRGGAWFERGALKVHLGVEKEFRPARKAHPALLVEGLRKIVHALRGAGYEIVDDEPLAGFVRVYVDDPFGNRIELMEPAS